MTVRWILEPELMTHVHARLRRAAERAGHIVDVWRDEDWPDRVNAHDGQFVVFHGSLGNADRVAALGKWQPGAYCNTAAFSCSAWYDGAKDGLLHRRWVETTVSRFAQGAVEVVEELGGQGRAFVRPDSPLKPFSGRVVEAKAVTMESLDYGFYYEDPDLPIIVAPIREVTREWRYVVAEGTVVAGSAYEADGRETRPDSPSGEPWQFAAKLASSLSPPDPVYVLDVCECDDELWLLELNPFSGADLYGCEMEPIVEAVARLSQAGTA